MFDMKRPCKSCPFRVGKGEAFALDPDRLEGIRTAAAFQCHQSVDYSRFEDEDGRQGDRPQQCTGLMAILHREGTPNQIMQVAERFGALDPAQLDPRGEAYSSWHEALAAHGCTGHKPNTPVDGD